MFKGLYIAFLTAIIFSFPSSAAGNNIPMVCTWSLFSDEFKETDTFIFNMNSKVVYWAEENQHIKFTKTTEAYIDFEGVPFSRVVIDKSKYKTHIPIKFTLNRLTGALKVKSEYAKKNVSSKCVLAKPLL